MVDTHTHTHTEIKYFAQNMLPNININFIIEINKHVVLLTCNKPT